MVKRGIHSQADIEARCEISGTCWLWQGAKNAQGYPIMNKDGRVQTVTSWLFEHRNGRPVKPDHVIRMRCYDQQCVSPTCMRETSKSDLVRAQWNGGRRSRTLPAHHLRSLRQKAYAAGWTKLDESKAAEIRSLRGSGLLYKEIAPLFGVCPATIGRVVRGELWPLHAPNSSVFAWRPAA